MKLTDFGLARAMDRMTVTLPGVVVGKLAYVAPELIAAERSTAASDIYSLGVVLWEMLAGRRLFQAQNELELFILRGRMEIGLQDGSSRIFGPGEHFYSDDRLPEAARFDRSVHGHWSRQVGPEDLVTAFVRA